MVSVRERRNRKNGRAKTAEQLHHHRCGICMERIRRGEATRPHDGTSGLAHQVCPMDWPRPW